MLIVIVLIFLMQLVPFLNLIDIKIYYLIVIFLVLTMFSYFMGILLGKPTIAIIEWLKDLSKGNFNKDDYMEKFSFLWNKKGNINVYYLPFKEIILFLSELTVSLQQNKLQNEKINETKEQWVAGVSHDIKTPLSYIKGYLDIIGNEDIEMTKSERNSAMDLIKKKVADIEALLNMFQIKQNQNILQKVRTDFVSFLKTIILDVANNPKASNYNFSFETNVSSFNYYFDQKILKRIMQNLLMNAVLHNSIGTNITIKLEVTAEKVNIRIIDDGVGIPPCVVKNVFAKERVASGSHGLGLIVVKELVDKHQGNIDIYSKPTQGTVINLDFKRSE
ncbi:HAMP domain-containing histidine kinase [Bacillus sp. Bva_UNVM-123]|uniref:sensor histidine kinase n=1 Tax=Bacillus sp. Bva_UNVM-123 TaxID=2829798 RepID=UPI00391F2EA5